MGSLPCDVRKPRTKEPVGLRSSCCGRPASASFCDGSRPRDGAPESDRLHVLFYVPHSSAPENSGKRPVRQRKSKLFATGCANLFVCISMTGRRGASQAWQYLPASAPRCIVGGTSAAICSRKAARYTNERVRFRRLLESRRGATHGAPLRSGIAPGTIHSPLGRQRMWRPVRLLSCARLRHRGGIRSRSRARWDARDAAFPSSLP